MFCFFVTPNEGVDSMNEFSPCPAVEVTQENNKLQVSTHASSQDPRVFFAFSFEPKVMEANHSAQ